MLVSFFLATIQEIKLNHKQDRNMLAKVGIYGLS